MGARLQRHDEPREQLLDGVALAQRVDRGARLQPLPPAPERPERRPQRLLRLRQRLRARLVRPRGVQQLEQLRRAPGLPAVLPERHRVDGRQARVRLVLHRQRRLGDPMERERQRLLGGFPDRPAGLPRQPLGALRLKLLRLLDLALPLARAREEQLPDLRTDRGTGGNEGGMSGFRWERRGGRPRREEGRAGRQAGAWGGAAVARALRACTPLPTFMCRAPSHRRLAHSRNCASLSSRSRSAARCASCSWPLSTRIPRTSKSVRSRPNRCQYWV